MPRISEFHGIIVFMHFNDHPPPHFHAHTAEWEARLTFRGMLLGGSLPPRDLRRVRRWCHAHRFELEVCWRRLRAMENPGTIDPLP